MDAVFGLYAGPIGRVDAFGCTIRGVNEVGVLMLNRNIVAGALRRVGIGELMGLG